MSRRRVSKWSKHEHEHRVASLRVALEGKGKRGKYIFLYEWDKKRSKKKRSMCDSKQREVVKFPRWVSIPWPPDY